MRISIRRCLSMLRNTSDGNELALPATNALRRSIVSVGDILCIARLGTRLDATVGCRTDACCIVMHVYCCAEIMTSDHDEV